MDTMTRLAALAADCMKSLWPEAEGLPAAEELPLRQKAHPPVPRVPSLLGQVKPQSRGILAHFLPKTRRV